MPTGASRHVDARKCNQASTFWSLFTVFSFFGPYRCSHVFCLFLRHLNRAKHVQKRKALSWLRTRCRWQTEWSILSQQVRVNVDQCSVWTLGIRCCAIVATSLLPRVMCSIWCPSAMILSPLDVFTANWRGHYCWRTKQKPISDYCCRYYLR